nr:hypothetical protein [Tanacetum cinerariifolium]
IDEDDHKLIQVRLAHPVHEVHEYSSLGQIAPLVVPPTLSSQKAPIDKVPVLPKQHQISFYCYICQNGGVTTIVPDPLLVIVQRVSELEKDVQELKQVDHHPTILAMIRSQLPAVVNEYLGSSLGDALQKVPQKHTEELIQQSSQKYVYEIIKMKQEQAAKEKMPKFSATPYDQAIEAEFKQKEILLKMMRESKVIPDLKKRDRKEDEAHSTRSNQGKRMRSLRKDCDPLKTSSSSKETSKGDTPPKSSKTGKSTSTEESVKEATHEFKQPLRPTTLDPEWNKCQVVDDQPEQTWFNDLVYAQNDPLTFDELMATPIEFSKFAKNRLKLDKITKADLVGPVYNLLKGTCQSSIKLEYNMEEFYKALTDKLDLSKPLPLKGRLGHLIVALEYFFNNDCVLEIFRPRKEVYYINYKYEGYKVRVSGYRRHDPEAIEYYQSRFFKHDVYSSLKIMSVVSVTVNKLHGYGYLEEITVRRANRQKYKFKEGNFINLHLNAIEDMLLLVIQHKLFHLKGDVIVDLEVVLRMFTKELSIKDFLGISAKELYIPSF